MKKCVILMISLGMTLVMLFPQLALADSIVWEDHTKTGTQTHRSPVAHQKPAQVRPSHAQLAAKAIRRLRQWEIQESR